jgi:hypothetical protein
MREVWRTVIIFLLLNLADGKDHNATSTTGLVDFIREAVWGDAKGGGGAYGQSTIPRVHPIQPAQSMLKTPPVSSYSVIGGNPREKAKRLIKEVEIEPDGRTINSAGESNGVCYVGACCGWGHRLMRQVSHSTFGVALQCCGFVIGWVHLSLNVIY